jgi:flagellar protein FliS
MIPQHLRSEIRMSYAASRSRYVSDAVSTASPAALLIMLYDRLLLDLERGEALISGGDRNGASIELQHAQEIIMEFRLSLDVESWEGGAGLEALYSFLYSELVRANTTGDAPAVRACRNLIAPLRASWFEAAEAVTAALAPRT